MGEDPAPCVLFAHTFEHQELSERVDEIRFTEPVLVTACEILDSASSCSALSIEGETHPSSFALELFAHVRGECRFRAVCPAFCYSSSSSTPLDIEVIVTDHMVLRGVYSALTLVIYGNPVKDLDLSCLVDDPVDGAEEFSSAKNRVLSDLRWGHSPQLVKLLWKLVRLAASSNAARAALIRAALSFRRVDRKSSADEQRRIILSLTQAVEEAEMDPVEKEENSDDTNEKKDLQTVLNWIDTGLRLTPKKLIVIDPENKFLTALAAVQLVCVDIDACFDFVIADGMHLLIKVLRSVTADSTVAISFALQALELSSRHGFACEALIGGKDEPEMGYAAILSTLLQAQRPCISQLSVEVLHRLRVYELAARFQVAVEFLVEVPTDVQTSREPLCKAIKSLRLLTNVLHLRDDFAHSSRFLLREFEQDGSSQKVSDDHDDYLFTVLQERRLLSSIAALISAPLLRQRGCMIESNLILELMCTVQRLLLHLLSSGHGLLVLAADSEVVAAVMNVLCGLQPLNDRPVLPLKHAAELVTENFVFHPEEIGKLLQTSLSAMNAFEHLLKSEAGSKESLRCLAELVKLSRTQAGRQALLTSLKSTEALSAIIEILECATVSTKRDELATHYAAGILYVLLTDSALSTWTYWISQASKLQQILPVLKDADDEIAEKALVMSRLMDTAVVYDSKGAIGLLRYSAYICSSPEFLEPDNEQNDSSDVIGKVLGGGSALSDAVVLQLTTSMQILASVCSPSIAAALIGEGAITSIIAILEYSASVLQDQVYEEVTSILKLLVPTLALLSSLFQRLQLEAQQFRSTKLVTVLMQLHRLVSSFPATHTMAPPYSWEAGGLELSAILRLLASNLAYWPVFAWEPTLLPRLFGSDSMDPIETCSSLILLGDLLPPETGPVDPCSIYRNTSLEVFLGTTTIRWHTQTPFKETLMEALLPSILRLADVVLQLVSTASDLLLSMVKIVVIRLCCANARNSAAIMRPLLTYIEEQASSVTSEADSFRVHCCIKFLAELAIHPASKAVLLQEKSVKYFCQTFDKLLPVKRHGRPTSVCWILSFFSGLCDSGCCLSFEDCRHMVCLLNAVLKELNIEDGDYEVFAEFLDRFSCLRLGRAAFISVFSRLEDSCERKGSDDEGENVAYKANDGPEPLFSQLSRGLSKAMDSENVCHSLLLGRIRAFARGAVRLAAAGKSFLGLGALKILFGESEAEDDRGTAEVLQLIRVIERKEDEGMYSADDRKNAGQAKDELQVILRLVQRPLLLQEVLNKVNEIEASSSEKCSSPSNKTPGHLIRFLPSVMCEMEVEDGKKIEKRGEQAIEDSFGSFRSSFTWECSSDLAVIAPKRKSSGRSKPRKKLRAKQKKTVYTDDYDAEERGLNISSPNPFCMDEPTSLIQFEEVVARQRRSTSEELSEELTEDQQQSYFRNEDERSNVVIRIESSNSAGSKQDCEMRKAAAETVAEDLQASVWKSEENMMNLRPPPPPPLPRAPGSSFQQFQVASQLSDLHQSSELTIQMQNQLFQPQFSVYQFQPQQHHPHLQQEQFHVQPTVYQQRNPVLPPPPPPQQSWNSLQQLLASPEAMQELLKDQTRLTMLLEQHPRLLSLLQERLG